MADRRVDERRELGAVELGQAVDGALEEVGARVLEAVPARVVGRVAQAEVGPEVDDRGARVDEVRARARRPRRGGGPGRRRPPPAASASTTRPVVGEVRVDAVDRVVVAVAAGRPTIVDVRVAGEEADQLGADVAGRADDADPDAPRPVVAGDAPLRARQNPDERSVAPWAAGSSPALTGARQPLTGGGLEGVAGTDGPSSWSDDYTGRCIVMQPAATDRCRRRANDVAALAHAVPGSTPTSPRGFYGIVVRIPDRRTRGDPDRCPPPSPREPPPTCRRRG